MVAHPGLGFLSQPVPANVTPATQRERKLASTGENTAGRDGASLGDDTPHAHVPPCQNHEDPDPDPDPEGRWALQAKKGTEGEEKAAHTEQASDSRGL